MVSRRLNGHRYEAKGFTKGGTDRVIPIDTDLLRELLAAVLARRLPMDSTEPIFVGRDGEYLDKYEGWRVVKEALRSAGLPELSQKHLRSSYCSWLQDNGTSPEEARMLMGHKSVRTTQLYSTAMPESLRRTSAVFASRIKRVAN